ncbi:MAG: flagellar biosynthetic protein FliR [Leptospirillia bacterium]
MVLPFTFAEFPAFAMVLVRVGAIIGTMPLLGEQTVPRQVKVLTALLLAFLLFPMVRGGFIDRIPENPLAWVPALGLEMLLGGVIGFTVRLITTAFEFAGEVIGFTMGLSLAQAVDPQTQLQVPLIGQFLTVMTFLVFLSINAHHILLGALVDSFSWLPPFTMQVTENFADLMINLVFEVFRTGLQIAAPILIALLLANAGLGIISRAVPQMHVMLVAMPLTITLGIVMLGVSIPFLAGMMITAYNGVDATLADLFVSLR